MWLGHLSEKVWPFHDVRSTVYSFFRVVIALLCVSAQQRTEWLVSSNDRANNVECQLSCVLWNLENSSDWCQENTIQNISVVEHRVNLTSSLFRPPRTVVPGGLILFYSFIISFFNLHSFVHYVGQEILWSDKFVGLFVHPFITFVVIYSTALVRFHEKMLHKDNHIIQIKKTKSKKLLTSHMSVYGQSSWSIPINEQT